MIFGIILFAIALGNYLGGRLADIRPNATLLWQIFALAGFSTALLPLVGRPILALAIPALVTFDAISGAASFLGIAGLVALKGYDGMIYATGWLVGWPALMFLIAEPLRNL